MKTLWASASAAVIVILFVLLSFFLNYTGLGSEGADVLPSGVINFFSFSFARALQVLYASLFISLIFLNLFKFSERKIERK